MTAVSIRFFCDRGGCGQYLSVAEVMLQSWVVPTNLSLNQNLPISKTWTKLFQLHRFIGSGPDKKPRPHSGLYCFDNPDRGPQHML